ncbi:putative acyl-CoA dehydrogenase [Mycobacterium xenopi 3993]|nr:putative acyl-CoA dehydrogenase [Mycobacterium xenopi 3993]
MTIWTTPERDQLRKTVRSFAEREILPHVDEWERIGELPRELHRRAGAAGLLGAGFPEAVGGGGGDGADSVIICEELHEAGVPGGVYASLFTCGIAVPHMIASGDERLIQTFVRPTLAGEKIGALAITEPGGGSDVGHLRTTAVRDGDHYIVNGAKTYITSGSGPTTWSPRSAPAARVPLACRCWWWKRAHRGSRSPASSTRWVGAPRIPPSCPTPTRGCRRLILSAPKTAASPRSHRLSWQNVSALPRKRIRVHNAAWTSRGSGAATGKPSADR